MLRPKPDVRSARVRRDPTAPEPHYSAGEKGAFYLRLRIPVSRYAGWATERSSVAYVSNSVLREATREGKIHPDRTCEKL
jgi:hypothetical protein